MPKNLFAGDRDRVQPSPIAIVYEPIESLKPDPENERQHSKKQIRQLANCIRRFGFNGVVLVDDQKNIIAGHARVEAAKQLGLPEIPTVLIGHLTPQEVRAFRLADNKLALNAT